MGLLRKCCGPPSFCSWQISGGEEVSTAVASGTNAGTAVYNNAAAVPAIVDSAGGLSPYGTMGQGGNVWEWNESATDGSNSSSSEFRVFRGGYWGDDEQDLRSSERIGVGPELEGDFLGFRVASVPEPSTYALFGIGAIGMLMVLRRKKTA